MCRLLNCCGVLAISCPPRLVITSVVDWTSIEFLGVDSRMIKFPKDGLVTKVRRIEIAWKQESEDIHFIFLHHKESLLLNDYQYTE